METVISLAESETISLLFKEQRQKEVKNGFFGLSGDSLWASTGYANHPIEIINPSILTHASKGWPHC